MYNIVALPEKNRKIFISLLLNIHHLSYTFGVLCRSTSDGFYCLSYHGFPGSWRIKNASSGTAISLASPSLTPVHTLPPQY